MEENIKKYFDLIQKNLDRNLKREDISLIEKEKIKIRKEIINEMKDRISWQFKKEEDKQAIRIQWLAIMRKSNTPEKFIGKQRKAIHIYELIKLTIPYIKALNSSLLEKSVIGFLTNIIVLIDSNTNSFSKDFPKKNEIDNAFKSYFEVIKPTKGNGNMFEECYDKIEYLYNELQRINE